MKIYLLKMIPIISGSQGSLEKGNKELLANQNIQTIPKISFIKIIKE
jgi:hypothetical protein